MSNFQGARGEQTGWSRHFDDPIPTGDGGELRSLRDVGVHILALPPPQAEREHWQAAIEALILVAERGGPTMLARIGVLRASHRHHVREFNSDRKPHHWGKRKLKRDL